MRMGWGCFGQRPLHGKGLGMRRAGRWGRQGTGDLPWVTLWGLEGQAGRSHSALQGEGWHCGQQPGQMGAGRGRGGLAVTPTEWGGERQRFGVAWLPDAQAVGFIACLCFEGSFVAVGTEGGGGHQAKRGRVCVLWGSPSQQGPAGQRREGEAGTAMKGATWTALRALAEPGHRSLSPQQRCGGGGVRVGRWAKGPFQGCRHRWASTGQE